MHIVKKSHLEVIFNFTKGTEGLLTLAESRARDNFIKKLAETTQTYLDERTKIYLEFCYKKEDGSPDLLNEQKYQFPKEKFDEINAELQTLADETVEVDAPEKLKEILEKSDYKPKVGEAEIIDEFMAKL